MSSVLGSKPKNKLFLGSSNEAFESGALDLLEQKLQTELSQIEIISWKKADWNNLGSTLDRLIENTSEYTYAVFLAWPDDILTSRNQKYFCTRDNVIFEFGLFLSALGKKRTFLITPKNLINFKFMSDLSGAYNSGTYEFKKQYTIKDLGLINNLKAKDIGSSINFDVESLTTEILTLDINFVNPKSAATQLEALLVSLKAEFIDNNDHKSTRALSSAIPDLLKYKSIINQKTITESAQDVLLFTDYMSDLCSPSDLEKIQTSDQGIKKVTVFAAEPLEFSASNQLISLNTIIAKNLKEGVKYDYYVSTDFAKNGINSVESFIKNYKLTKFAKNISFHVIDTKYFKTFFTIHDYGGIREVYMSGLNSSNRSKDLLIKVTDMKQAENIFNYINVISGTEKKTNSLCVKTYTL